MDPIYNGDRIIDENNTNLIIEEETSNTNDSEDQNSIINKKKWRCLQCTYENWPSALKCTICSSMKPVANLTQHVNNSNNNSSNNNNSCNAKLKPCVDNQFNTSNVNRNNKINKLMSSQKYNSNNNIVNKANKKNDSKKNIKLKPKLESCSNNESTDANSTSLDEKKMLSDWNLSCCGSNSTQTKTAIVTNDIYKIGDLLINSCMRFVSLFL